jgi:replicative DNA helicase
MGFEILGPDSQNITKGYRRKDAVPLAFRPDEKPHDLDTERAVLAGLFLFTECFSDVQNLLKDADFFLPAHTQIYSCMRKLSLKNIPIDITTVAGFLRDEGTLESCGGAPYLSQIASIPMTSMHTVEYARIIADLAWRRRLLEVSDRCRSSALRTGDTRDIAAEIEQLVFGATQEKKNSQMARVGDLLDNALHELERRADTKGLDANTVMTGLRDLDETLGGFRPGQLLVLAAGPGTGKTSLAANIMYHAAVKQQKNVLFFSLEMTQNEVVERILAFAANVDSTKLRSGNLSPKDFNMLFQAADEIQSAPMYVDDRSAVTPYDILAQARKLSAEINIRRPGQKVDLIVADYIQIMKSGGSTENRALEVAAITGGLKAIAKEMKVPVLALSQLNRDRAKRAGDNRPQLSDLKDSGAIEADADAVMFIHREQQGSDTDSRAPAKAEIIIAKQRSGPTGTINLTWLGHLTRFTDYVDSDRFGPPPAELEGGGREPDIGMDH